MLEVILERASKIFITQHNLYEEDVMYWLNFTQQELYDSTVVFKRKVIVVERFQKLVYSKDLEKTLQILETTYIENLDFSSNKHKSPILVFCTSVNLASGIVERLKLCAPNEEAASRIKGLWANIQDTEWNSNFMKRPNSCESAADVLVMTHCCPAGLSIETHYRQPFY